MANLRQQESQLRERRESLEQEHGSLTAEYNEIVLKPREDRTEEEAARIPEIDSRLKALNGDIAEAEAAIANVQAQRDYERYEAPVAPDSPRLSPTATIQPAHGNGPYASLGEQAMDLYRMATGQDATARERLTVHMDNYLKSQGIMAATGQNTVVDSEGGFLVQTDFASEIWRRMSQDGEILSRVNPLPLTPPSNAIELPGVDETSRANGSRWGGITGHWTEEGGAITASKQEYFRVALRLKKVAALTDATEEMLAHVALMNTLLNEGMSDELRFLVEDAIFEGNGIGKPFGILDSPATIEVSEESGQTATTIVYENIINMWARLHPRSRANAVWYVNTDVMPQLDLLAHQIERGTDGLAVLEPKFVTYNPQGILVMKGRPVVEIEYASTMGTVGDIVLADMSQYAFISSALQTAASIHFRFNTDEQTFRATMRVDGASRWKSALTPFKGTDTTSPFVKLETRD